MPITIQSPNFPIGVPGPNEFTDELLNTSAIVIGSWVKITNNASGNAYISSAATNGVGQFTIAAPAGTYTVYTGPTNVGPWTATGNANYRVANTVPVFNVMDYGAIGDGTTDDTVAVQNTINAANTAGGGIAYFPKGTYLVSTLVYAANVTLQGQGKNGALVSQITQKGGTPSPILTEPGTSFPYLGVAIDGIAFDAFNNQTSNTGGIRLRGTTNAQITNCRVAFTANWGIQVIGGGTAGTGDAMYVNIDHNKIENLLANAAGIQVTVPSLNGSHPDGCVITHNFLHFSASGTVGVKVDAGGFNSLGPDSTYIAFNRFMEIPTPIDLNSQSAVIFANRFEIVSTPTMTIIVEAGPSNFPSLGNHFIANDYATSGNPALLTFTDNGSATSRVDEKRTGSEVLTLLQGITTATPNRGLLSLGRPFDGAAAGFFVGNAQGTYLAVNGGTGFTGNLVDIQLTGSPRFSVDSAGHGLLAQKLTISAGGLGVTGATSVTQDGQTVALASASAATASRIHFFDQATEKWQVGKEADNRFFVWDSVHSRYALSIFAGSPVTIPVNGLSVTGAPDLTLGTTTSRIVPGATSLSLRNNANSADNLIITDAGIATFRGGFAIDAAGHLISTSAGTPSTTNLGANVTSVTFTGNDVRGTIAVVMSGALAANTRVSTNTFATSYGATAPKVTLVNQTSGVGLTIVNFYVSATSTGVSFDLAADQALAAGTYTIDYIVIG
jgi:hypothetical protein